MKTLRVSILMVALLSVLSFPKILVALNPVVDSQLYKYNCDFTGTLDNVANVSGSLKLSTYTYSYADKLINFADISSTFAANNTAQSGTVWKPSAPYNTGTITKVNTRYYWHNDVTNYYDRYHGVQAASSAPGTSILTPKLAGTLNYAELGQTGSWYDNTYTVNINSNVGMRLTGYVGSWTSATTSTMRYAYVSGSFTAWQASGTYTSKVIEINPLTDGKFYSFGKVLWGSSEPGATNVVIQMRVSATSFTATAAAPSWNTLSSLENLNDRFGGVDAKYFQLRATLNGTSTAANPTPSYTAAGTPTLDFIDVDLIFERTLNDPEAHDGHFSYNTPTSFDATGAQFDGGGIVRAGTGIRVQQYTQYNQNRPINYTLNPAQTNTWQQNPAANTAGWFPPYPGTIKQVNVNLYWITSTETSDYNQKAYIKQVSGAASFLGSPYVPPTAPGNGWYSGTKTMVLNSNLGLKITAFGASRHDTPNAATASPNQTSKLNYAICDELKYHANKAYYSTVHCYGDPAAGGNGFSWGHILWNTIGTDANNTLKLYVRGNKTSFSTTAAAGSTNVNWTLILDSATGAEGENIANLLKEMPYMQYRIDFKTNTFKTPEVDWVTIKYFTNTAPTLTIIEAIKGSASYPDYDLSTGYHEKPPLTGSPNNDVRYSTGATCGSWPTDHVTPSDPANHSEKPNLIARNVAAAPELYIKIKIVDPEGDPVSVTDWEYTVKSDMDNGIWYNFAQADVKWDHRNSSDAIVTPLVDITTAKSPLTVSTDYYTLCFSNLNQYFAGAYTHVYFRCKAYDTIFSTDYITMSEAQKFFVDFNSPPVISSADLEILPDPAYTTDTLTLNTSSSASDPDATPNPMNGFRTDVEHLSFVTEWSVNGSAITGINTPTLPSNYFIKGDEVMVSVYPFDGSVTALDFPERGKEFGRKASTTRIIKNKPPVITSITLSPSTPYTNDDLICTVVATDDDEFIWRQTDFKDATINVTDLGDGKFDPINCDGNVTTTDVDLDGEWELQLK